MNFGNILDKWEKTAEGTRRAGDAALGREDAAVLPPGERRSRLLRKKPDAVIDLHGLTRNEAWTALETFFQTSRSQDCEKLLIVHGKGNHQRSALSPDGDDPSSEGALRELCRRFIESCPFAGESGYNPAKDGGTGATWVILKE